MKQVLHYGILPDDDGIRYLYQNLTPDGFNYVGVRDNALQTARGLKFPCPHAIVPTLGFRQVSNVQWGVFEDIITDPLVAAMLPIPKQDAGAHYLIDDGTVVNFMEYLSCLENLSTPIMRSTMPIWSVNWAQFKRMITSTNIHPLVLTGAKIDDAPTVNKFLELAKVSPRTLIITGVSDLITAPDIPRIEFKLNRKINLCNLISLHMEHIGVEIIRRYCQKLPILVKVHPELEK